MLLVVLTGIATTLLCLILQGIFLGYAVRGYVRLRLARLGRPTKRHSIILLSLVMTLMLIANIIQMAIWAALFMLLGEFDDFEVALYHSGVNFVTLGYGDIVMSERHRLLGALEAINGVLMIDKLNALKKRMMGKKLARAKAEGRATAE